MRKTMVKDICSSFKKSAGVLLRGLRDECTTEGRQRHGTGYIFAERLAIDRYEGRLWKGPVEEREYRLLEIVTRRDLRVKHELLRQFKSDLLKGICTGFELNITNDPSVEDPIFNDARKRIDSIMKSDSSELDKLDAVLSVILHCENLALQKKIRRVIRRYYKSGVDTYTSPLPEDYSQPRHKPVRTYVIDATLDDTGKTVGFWSHKKTFLAGLAATAIFAFAYPDKFDDILGNVRTAYQKVMQSITSDIARPEMPVVPPAETPKQPKPSYNPPENRLKPYELQEDKEPQILISRINKKAPYPTHGQAGLVLRVQHRAAM